jgi:NAD(P)-dependent dehydrogenase (short-subunit alcohol dehydrogenase family)
MESAGAARGLVLADMSGDAAALGAALSEALSAAGWRVGRFGAAAESIDEDVVEAMFDRLLGETGDLGACVLVADVRAGGMSLADSGPEEWEAALGTCLRAAFLLLRRAVDEFIGAGDGGRILVVLIAPAAPATIAAALATALSSLSKAIATEYGRRAIACNTLVVPADGETAIDAAVEAASFLLSADAGYITAEVIDLREAPAGVPVSRGPAAT